MYNQSLISQPSLLAESYISLRRLYIAMVLGNWINLFYFPPSPFPFNSNPEKEMYFVKISKREKGLVLKNIDSPRRRTIGSNLNTSNCSLNSVGVLIPEFVLWIKQVYFSSMKYIYRLCWSSHNHSRVLDLRLDVNQAKTQTDIHKSSQDQLFSILVQRCGHICIFGVFWTKWRGSLIGF